MKIDTHFIAAVSADLADMLGDDFDPATFWDTLDGETDALDLIDRLLATMQEDEALEAAIRAQEADLKRRRDRIAARVPAKRKALAAILHATGQKKVERPRATVSLRPGVVSVRIINEADIPSQLQTVKTTTAPDKAAIKKHLEAGEAVPGAELVRGDETISVRVA